MSTDATKVETSLTNINKMLKKVAEDTAAIRKAGRLDELAKELPPLEYAKLCSSIGYTINCLYKSRLELISLHEGERCRRDQSQDIRGD